jgi:acetyl-CoA carboxylase, biotin carboxylase subunit
MFHKVVVANRGAVAARILRTLRQLRVRSVAVYSEPDAGLPYLAEADETACIGPADPRASYLDQEALLRVLKDRGADGLHPGYGFLSENGGFARKVNDTGARFIGPDPQWIDAMGHKTRARELMARHGMTMAPSSGLVHDAQQAIAAARALGYPVLVKPAAGGGGIGMQAAADEVELARAVERAASLAQRSFGNAEIYLEALLHKPRHVEFQVLADRHGHVRHLFERDCSIQRRHQKVVEESPAPKLPRLAVDAAAQRVQDVLARIGYDVIGTVETLYADGGAFQFLEVNTRLQVEHAVTEEITGIDLVAAQVRLAAGERLDQVLPAQVVQNGHAIEARLYAEDPVRFFPSPGKLDTLRLPQGPGIRVETGFAEGCTVTPHFDPMVAKLIVHAEDRPRAITRMLEALDATVIEGVKHNLPFVRAVVDSAEFRAGDVHTGLAAEVQARRLHKN